LLNDGAAYFNAGVLVLELEKIRESRLFEKAAGLLQSSSLSFKFWDQSALNYAANGKFDLLESDWNRQTHRGSFDPVEVLPGLARRSLNVHFVTPAKPWLAWSPFPAETMFRDLLDVVDPDWRGETFTAAESRTRRKLRFARGLGPFFTLRGMVRKSASDRRIAEFWRIFCGDLDALRRRRIEFEDMLAGWRREISMKTR
jgi:hypothetical protein